VTVASSFISWNRGRTPGAPFTKASPNLLLLSAELRARWNMKNLGCYVVRPVRGGTAWSSHAFGAAVDLGYGERHGGPGLAVVEAQVLPWLIENSAELGIQRIHLYQRTRYWEAGRGWVDKSPGAGNDWIHVETHPDRWADITPIAQRLSEGSQTASSVPQAPSAPKYPGRPLKRGSTGQAVKEIQRAVGLADDGKYGPQTEARVRAWQTEQKLTADGIVGPVTWKALFA